jgi:hypothetical protein
MDEETLGARRYQRLVWALRWIAAEPEATLAALEFGLPPNEIASSSKTFSRSVH